MLKNEESRQKYPLFKKRLNEFEAEWIACGLHLQSSQKRVKRLPWLCGYWVGLPKTYFLQR